MKHTFFVFPAGLTGTALLLLRISVVISVITFPAQRLPLLSWPAVGLDMVAIAIGLGLYTRIAVIAAATGMALLMVQLDSPLPIPFLAQALDAAVLAMVGPGAFSIDAKMFGRRTVHLSS